MKREKQETFYKKVKLIIEKIGSNPLIISPSFFFGFQSQKTSLNIMTDRQFYSFNIPVIIGTYMAFKVIEIS